MKNLMLCLILVSLTGCASMQSKMNRLAVGMTKEQVAEKIGNPDTTEAKDGTEIMRYDEYAVTMKDGKATGFGHMDTLFPPSPEELEMRRLRAQVEAERRKQNQAFWNSFSQQQKPARMYQPARPVQTNCTTYGNQTNCMSQPTGIDASIYNQ